jgi:two-component system, chemotaxis family, protein-glutamate methylesterase/glutaminase
MIREAGGLILAQDEASSVVWGMPGAVATAGFAHEVLPIPDIVASIHARIHRLAVC